jgi:hypothetical protein
MARPTKAQSVIIAERRAKAVDMRMTGAGFAAIAAALGYKTSAAACQDVSRALESAVAAQSRSVEAYREEELQRLDLLLSEAWAILKRDHITVSHGRVVRDDDDQPILDDGPTLQAIDRILKIQERRAKFLGLDAPVKVEAITVDAIDAEISRLAAELERSPAGEAAGAAPAQD